MGYYDSTLQLKSELNNVREIGRSLFGRQILCFGSNEPRLTIIGGTHAREFAAIKVCLRLIEELQKSSLSLPVSIIPLMNPDGVCLVEEGLRSAPRSHRALLKDFGDFADWKANGRAVDLNVNFDADWGRGAGNVRRPSPAGYIGEKPFSEPESQAIRDYLTTKRPLELWCMHSRGEVVYYGYGDKVDPSYGQKVASLLGYIPSVASGSTGGIKDWYISRYDDVRAVTIEIGPDEWGYVETADNKEYIDMITNRIYGYLISAFL